MAKLSVHIIVRRTILLLQTRIHIINNWDTIGSKSLLRRACMAAAFFLCKKKMLHCLLFFRGKKKYGKLITLLSSILPRLPRFGFVSVLFIFLFFFTQLCRIHGWAFHKAEMSATASPTVRYSPFSPKDSKTFDWCNFSVTLPTGFANTSFIENTKIS